MRIVTVFYRHNGRTLLYRIFAGIYAIAREITPIVVFSLSFKHDVCIVVADSVGGNAAAAASSVVILLRF